MKTVVDASAVLSWVLEDERDELAIAMAKHVLENGAYVPPLFVGEAQNVLLVAVRRKRTTLAKATDILRALARLPLRVETRGIELGSARAIEAAERCGLSAYDAMYLVLAQEIGANLMTRDRRLRIAAKAEGVLWEAAGA